MQVQELIDAHIASQAEPKRSDLLALHTLLLSIKPEARLWFYDGRDDNGKIVTNPNIGYGFCTLLYAKDDAKEFYQIGISATKTGISIYILGKKDLSYLVKTFAKTIGKATLTGYCIKFRKLQDVNLETLEAALRYGFKVE